jgi:hypothetical protein
VASFYGDVGVTGHPVKFQITSDVGWNWRVDTTLWTGGNKVQMLKNYNFRSGRDCWERSKEANFSGITPVLAIVLTKYLITWRQNMNVHHSIHKSPPPVPFLSQLDPLHTSSTNIPKIQTDPHLRLGLPSGLFLSGFHANILYTFLSSSMRVTCPAHLTLLDLICLMIFRDE